MKQNKPCPNCQSDNENIALTLNNTCPVCGRLLTDRDFEYKPNNSLSDVRNKDKKN